MEKLNLAERLIGPGEVPYIIAELGANHNGDMDMCRRLVDAAVAAKVDAVKFQSWSDKSLISRGEYSRNTSYADTKKHFGSLEEMVKKYQLTPVQHLEIQAYCHKKGVTFISTPFSMDEADMLDEMGVPFFKIASMDINHVLFLRHVARKKKPLIMSTAMSTIEEIEHAVRVVRKEGNDQLVLLHCVALYPPDFNDVNLRNIEMLRRTFGVLVGYSDHTIGIGCSLASIAMGACVVEKHFTLDKDMAGWDHAVSASPPEMAMIVDEGRNISVAIGRYQRVVGEDEVKKAYLFRRSLVVRHAMKADDVISEHDIDFKRPGTGIRPDEISYVVGRRLMTDIEEDDLLLWSHLL